MRTPAPWVLYKEYAPFLASDEEEAFHYAFQTHDHPSRYWISYINNTSIGLVARSAGASPQEAEANARLIACAPELLEACKALVASLDDSPNCTSPEDCVACATLNPIKALIAKAEGR